MAFFGRLLSHGKPFRTSGDPLFQLGQRDLRLNCLRASSFGCFPRFPGRLSSLFEDRPGLSRRCFCGGGFPLCNRGSLLGETGPFCRVLRCDFDFARFHKEHAFVQKLFRLSRRLALR